MINVCSTTVVQLRLSSTSTLIYLVTQGRNFNSFAVPPAPEGPESDGTVRHNHLQIGGRGCSAASHFRKRVRKARTDRNMMFCGFHTEHPSVTSLPNDRIAGALSKGRAPPRSASSPPSHSLSIFASGLDGLVSRHFTRRKSGRQAGRPGFLRRAIPC